MNKYIQCVNLQSRIIIKKILTRGDLSVEIGQSCDEQRKLRLLYEIQARLSD